MAVKRQKYNRNREFSYFTKIGLARIALIGALWPLPSDCESYMRSKILTYLKFLNKAHGLYTTALFRTLHTVQLFAYICLILLCLE